MGTDLSSDRAAAATAIADASLVVLACHVNPDGDALGSSLGFMHMLRAAGRPCVAAIPSPGVIAPHYRTFPGLDALVPPADLPAQPDVMVTFDCGSLARLGDLEEVARGASTLVVVDHHVSNTRYGAINLIEPDAAASAVVALDLARACGLELGYEAAYCFFAALVCDTGRFQYESTTPEVLELAGELLAFGVPVASLTRVLFEEHRFVYLKLVAEVLARAVLVTEKQFVWAAVSQADLRSHGVSIDETEGLIDLVRRTAEAEVACVLKEEPDGLVRVSLRSLGGTDVSKLAASFGGGGHRFAAGFTAPGPAAALAEKIEHLL